VRGLARTRLARSLYDAAWGSLLAMLRYKAIWYGRDLVAIDRFFPSTRVLVLWRRRSEAGAPRADMDVRCLRRHARPRRERVTEHPGRGARGQGRV
jgi:hypothetical protein